MQRTSDVLGVILVHGLWHGGWVWDAVPATSTVRVWSAESSNC